MPFKAATGKYEKRAAVRNMSRGTLLQVYILHGANRRYKTRSHARTGGHKEPRGNNESNTEITLADEENNNKTMRPVSEMFSLVFNYSNAV